jgi:hypothetical protein
MSLVKRTTSSAALPALALALALALTVTARAADAPLHRWRAPLTVDRAGAYVELPLPAEIYRRSVQPALADLRVVDADGARVPHAWLPEPAPVPAEPTLRPTALYPLPARSAAGGDGTLDIVLDGERVQLRRGGTRRAAPTSPGWIVDLGAPKAGEARPQALRLAWSGPAEFSIGCTLATSADLRGWRPAGQGALLSLNSAQGALVQRELPLPPDTPRFVRVQWEGASTTPQLTGAQAVRAAPGPAPAAPAELRLPLRAVGSELHADLGAAVPLVGLDLQLPAATRVLPLRVQGRLREGDAWQPLGSAVFYRLDAEGGARRSPAMTLHASVRYLRLLPDERAGAPDAATLQLIALLRPPRLLFAAQGRAPYALLAGSADAQAGGALPLATLVPTAGAAPFGDARLGGFSEVPAAVQAAEAARRRDALRPWLLWGVLGAGVAGLGAMVWRLARRPAA